MGWGAIAIVVIVAACGILASVIDHVRGNRGLSRDERRAKAQRQQALSNAMTRMRTATTPEEREAAQVAYRAVVHETFAHPDQQDEPEVS